MKKILFPKELWDDIIKKSYHPEEISQLRMYKVGVRLNRTLYFPFKDLFDMKDIYIFRNQIVIVKPLGKDLCDYCKIVMRIISVDDPKEHYPYLKLIGKLCHSCACNIQNCNQSKKKTLNNINCKACMPILKSLNSFLGPQASYAVYCEIESELTKISN
eukprot:NODE_1037_length_2504_cov_0.688565.p3 type:complete len:159 gc:universal NODE_1037_length_2504_cov_0.688565:600-1076(+)